MKKEPVSVLDAGAVLALARPGAYAGGGVVREAVTDPGNTCYAHGITLCEAYTVAMRHGVRKAEARALIQGVLVGHLSWTWPFAMAGIAHHARLSGTPERP